MKHNWKEQYPLQEALSNSDISEAVRERTLKKMSNDTQKGNIIMKTKNKKRIIAICVAAASILSISAIGIHAAASTSLWKEIKFWIDGEEMTASISKTDDDEIYVSVENNGNNDILFDEFEYTYSDKFDIVTVDALDLNFYTECDSDGKLWLKADKEDGFDIDITDAIVSEGKYTVNCIFGDGSTKTVTVEGSVENNTVTVTPVEIEHENFADIDIKE